MDVGCSVAVFETRFFLMVYYKLRVRTGEKKEDRKDTVEGVYIDIRSRASKEALPAEWGEEIGTIHCGHPCLQLDVIWASRERVKGLARCWFANGCLHDGRS